MAQATDIIQLLNKILKLMVKENASDLYIKADNLPHLKIQSELVPVEVEKFTPAMTEVLANEIMPINLKEDFKVKPEANFMYNLEGLARFRVNVYRQKGSIALVMRKIEEKIPDFQALNLPLVLAALSLEKRGLILVTGPTGSGKSSTLAAMVGYRNQNSSCHIITMEDPIEFMHKDANCLVSQREIGLDTMSFSDGLASALREAPDVLLIGEMRDLPSVQSAVFFSETGHLVLSTLHSVNATQTVERVLQFFPSEIHDQTCLQLSLTLKAIISQRLVDRKDGKGKLPAIEIMVMNARMRDLVSKAEFTQIKRELDLFHPEGMQSFDHSLLEMYKKDLITQETAIKDSDNPADMRLKIKTLPDYIKGSSGEDRYAPAKQVESKSPTE